MEEKKCPLNSIPVSLSPNFLQSSVPDAVVLTQPSCFHLRVQKKNGMLPFATLRHYGVLGFDHSAPDVDEYPAFVNGLFCTPLDIAPPHRELQL